MKRIIRLAVYAGMGLYDKVREEIEELISRGKLKRQEAELLLQAVAEREEELLERDRVQERAARLEAMLNDLRKDLQNLTPKGLDRTKARLEDLTGRVEALEEVREAVTH